MTPSDHPNKKSIYITADTEARLAALGGTTRAENVRRALDLVECAEGLASNLELMLREYCPPGLEDEFNQEFTALRRYQEAKHD